MSSATTWLSRSPPSQPSGTQPASPASQRHPGPSSQCQPADRRLRTSGWKLVRVCPALPRPSLTGRPGEGRCSCARSFHGAAPAGPAAFPTPSLASCSSWLLSLWEPRPQGGHLPSPARACHCQLHPLQAAPSLGAPAWLLGVCWVRTACSASGAWTGPEPSEPQSAHP